MDWGDLIKQLKARGWTQNSLAAEVGISQASISDLERSVTKNPSYAVGRAIEILHSSGRKPPQREAKAA